MRVELTNLMANYQRRGGWTSHLQGFGHWTISKTAFSPFLKPDFTIRLTLWARRAGRIYDTLGLSTPRHISPFLIFGPRREKKKKSREANPTGMEGETVTLGSERPVESCFRVFILSWGRVRIFIFKTRILSRVDLE